MGELISKEALDKLMTELRALDTGTIDVGGKKLKPSQCYYYDISPPYVLFNTNCPETLKSRIQQILAKYIPRFGRSV
jgi:hypothetical protein